ncbi:hypothetical protein E2C01_095268 [Portunus trituberculatus]|uniref:Uncharacterized protein n=1 Tax=Portunus trituberculatus TaxID=210409 RepID=A0A5B7K3S3_PORTR|nr:hypothetical protein [Portunus trituberculatus]
MLTLFFTAHFYWTGFEAPPEDTTCANHLQFHVIDSFKKVTTPLLFLVFFRVFMGLFTFLSIVFNGYVRCCSSQPRKQD